MILYNFSILLIVNLSQIKIIIGLGNPGNTYKHTFHNLGFIFIDIMIDMYDGRLVYENNKIKLFQTNNNKILCKPKTYMNLSGDAIKSLKTYLNINPKNLRDNMLVVHDEISANIDVIKYKNGVINPGYGGHNGLRSIGEAFMHLGLTKEDSAKFIRIQIGCNSKKRDEMSLADYVLKNIDQNLLQQFQALIYQWITKELQIK